MKKLLPVAFGCCLFFIILGAKWAVFDRYGSSMPDWDQWDAEAVELLVPWFEGNQFLTHLFTAHNEHRVVFTKLETLALTLANGQWDSRVQAVVNAILHSAIAVGLWVVARRWIAARWHAALFVLVIAMFALPFAWQNVLGGFHSQQYWLLGFSFATIVALPFVRPWTSAWCAAVAVAAMAIVTMGSGFLASAVVLVVVAFRWFRHEITARTAWPTLVATLAIVAVGWFTRVEPDFHASLRAHTIHDFVFSILRSMEWPLQHHDWAGVILWLPWFVVFWRVIRAPRDGATHRGGQTVAALGGWVMLQIVATAYARGVGADYPASRYMDTLGFGALINVVALAWLATPTPFQRTRPIALGVAAAAWMALFAVGLWQITAQALAWDLPEAKRYYGQAEAHLRGYLATNNPAHFALPDIPFPSADGLVERLDNPHLRALMPAVVRAPLPFRPAEDPAALKPTGPGAATARIGGTVAEAAERGAQTGFLENTANSLLRGAPPRRGLSPKTLPLADAKTWGSFGRDGTANVGEWRSVPLWSPLGAWLKFETAGQVGEPGVALELRDAVTGALLSEVRPSKVPADTWRAAYVRAPENRFVVVARDRDPARWLAFGAPVEVGPLSYWAWRVSKHGFVILWVSTAGAGLLALVGFWLRRTGAGPSPNAAAAPAVSAEVRMTA
ncbi:MAG: hypothetical protein Q7S40_02850 [Opitutaceae bacterium]|nr:hypothetical protein [Opitutaceae bacterium]